MSGADCVYCGEPVRLGSNSGHFMKVQGWAKLRTKGVNEVRFRKNLGLFLHKECADMIESGITPGQETFI